MPFGIQPIHIVVVVIAALLIFGPAKLPEIGRSIGRGLNEFRRGAKEMSANFMEEVNQTEDSLAAPSAPFEALKEAAPAPAPAPAQTVCPTCGNTNPVQSRFCNHCGAALG